LTVKPQVFYVARAYGKANSSRCFYINPVPPEQAAGFLQATEVDLSGKPVRTGG
jgi:hypothetical protein